MKNIPLDLESQKDKATQKENNTTCEEEKREFKGVKSCGEVLNKRIGDLKKKGVPKEQRSRGICSNEEEYVGSFGRRIRPRRPVKYFTGLINKTSYFRTPRRNYSVKGKKEQRTSSNKGIRGGGCQRLYYG